MDQRILEELASDSREKIVELAEKANCTPQTASKRLKRLEKIGLSHGIELETQEVGYATEYFVRVKLRSIDENRIKAVLDDCPYVQFAALTKGDFQLFIWAIAPNRNIYETEMEAKIRVELDEYIQDWHAHGLLLKRGGFLPVNNAIVDLMQIPDNEKETLRLLNENSRSSLELLSKEFGMSKTAVLYRVERAKKYVRRLTSYLPTPQNLLYVIRFFQICGNTETIAHHAPRVYNSYLHPDRRHIFNRTIYAAVPDGGMDNFFVEAFDDEKELEKHELFLTNLGGKIIRSEINARVKKIIKGTIPIRVIDLREDIPYLLSPVEQRR